MKTDKKKGKQISHIKKTDNRFVSFWKTKGNRGKKAAIIIVAIILVLTIVVLGFFYHKIKMIKTDENTENKENTYQDDVALQMMNGIENAKDLNSLLKGWATNGGELIQSKHVKNILCLGVDSKSNLSDSMMIISVNTENKKVTIVSIFRDCYIYIQPNGKTPVYSKLNSAYSRGGAQCVIDAIQNNFKIKIDGYVSVDLNSFPKIIDALGGVTVDVEPIASKTIADEEGLYIPPGTQTLNGEKALKYARTRHGDKDGEVSRTRRQRALVEALADKFKNASPAQINNAINIFLSNVKTSFSKGDILGLSTDALKEGWLKFARQEEAFPLENERFGQMLDVVGWVWICDYEKAAQDLQLMLYGKTNIVLSEKRKTATELVKKGAINSSYGTTKASGTTKSQSTTKSIGTTKLDTTSSNVTTTVSNSGD